MVLEFTFEKLNVWQLARKLASNIYITTRSFPSDERFGLTSQIRRSAISVAANLAEGSARNSAKDQAHFSSIAYGSLMELLNHLSIALDLEYISNAIFQEYRETIKKLAIKISNYRATQLKRIRTS